MAGTQQQTTKQHDAPRGGMRGWIAAHRIASAVAAVLVFAVAPLAGLWLLPSADEPEGPPTLAAALDALDRGDMEEARRQAQRLLDADTLTEAERWGPPLVLGVAASQQADGLLDQQRAQMSLVAARHLEDAHDLGCPPNWEPDVLWLLGKNLHRAGQLAASREPLEAALPLHPQHAGQIHQLLTEAWQAGQQPDLARALEHCRSYLAEPELFDEQRQQGLLQQAEILLRQKEHAQCRQVLDQIAATAPQRNEAGLLIGRMLMAEAMAKSDAHDSPDAEKLKQAIAAFEQAKNEGPAKDQVALRSAYLIGLCHQTLGDPKQALVYYAQAGQGNRPESMAALAHAAELLLAAGRDADAVAAYCRVLDHIPESGQPENPWMSLDELRSRATAAYLRLLEAAKHEPALQLLEAWHPTFSRARQLQLQAQTHRAWAVTLQESAGSLTDAAQPRRAQTEQQFRLAGQLYARLAELRFAEREYPDDLWDAVECLSAAHDYTAAIGVLQTYLKHEPVRRRSEALQRLGEALLVEGHIDEAVAALRESVEFDPKNAASYRSKILASKALIDAGDLAGAEALLLENIESQYLTPDSIEWRQTLFQLGRLLHLEGRWPQAIERLEEAVARYPQDPQTTLARYLIADSYRQRAKELSAERDQTVVESARIALTRELHRLLEAAIVQYDQTMAALQSPAEGSAATEPGLSQAMILRNSYFMKGAALFDLGNYEEAIRAYSSATNRYQQEPEVLDAYVKIAACYRRLNRQSEARGTIEQAKVVLSRMPADLAFAEKSNFDRQEWARHLEWLSGVY